MTVALDRQAPTGVETCGVLTVDAGVEDRLASSRTRIVGHLLAQEGLAIDMEAELPHNQFYNDLRNYGSAVGSLCLSETLATIDELGTEDSFRLTDRVRSATLDLVRDETCLRWDEVNRSLEVQGARPVDYRRIPGMGGFSRLMRRMPLYTPSARLKREEHRTFHEFKLIRSIGTLPDVSRTAGQLYTAERVLKDQAMLAAAFGLRAEQQAA